MFITFAVGVFASFIFAVQCDAVKMRFVLPRHGYRLTNGIFDQDLACPTLMACLTTCSHRPSCKSVSYRYSWKRCLHSWVAVTDDEITNHLLLTDENWITMSKAIYTVYIRMHPDDNAKLNYSEAVTLCNERNTVVASEADLMTSRDLGLECDYCNCAWLSNQRNGFIIQEGNTAYTHDVSPNVTYCDWDLADVWCRL